MSEPTDARVGALGAFGIWGLVPIYFKAAAGVGIQLMTLGALPWVSLVLAFSFGFYGLLRKRLPLGALNGLFAETLIAAPFAAGYLGWLLRRGALRFGHGSLGTDFLLVASGAVTAAPLLLFAAGARRLKLTTLGFFQYLAPTLTFLLGVFAYREPIGAAQLATFGFVWAGSVLYTADALRARQPAAASV